jgi:hypothetical protein
MELCTLTHSNQDEKNKTLNPHESNNYGDSAFNFTINNISIYNWRFPVLDFAIYSKDVIDGFDSY